MKQDCHMHMVLDGVDWKAAIARHKEGPQEQFIRRVLQRYHELGYDYLRDGGDRWGVGAKAREMAKEYDLTYRTPLAPVCKSGHYGAFIGQKYETLREFREIAGNLQKNGGDFLKIMISGLMDFDHFGVLSEEPLTAGEIRELIHIGHEEGLAVMVHANGARTVEAAATAGVDSVEHGAYLDEEALWAMKENGTVWVPTLSTIANLRGKDRFSQTDVEKILESARKNVCRFAGMGGFLACGSDAGAWAVPHGAETEWGLLTELTSPEVVRRGNEKIREKF